MKPPEKIPARTIVNITYYDKMTSDEREKVFEAYDFNRKEDVYELKHPELLTESLIKKLSTDN